VMFDWWEKLSGEIVFNLLHIDKGTNLGDAVHFFFFDTVKICFLVFLVRKLLQFISVLA